MTNLYIIGHYNNKTKHNYCTAVAALAVIDRLINVLCNLDP